MARKRMLSPEMFSSVSVCSWPIPTRWTWAGMLTYLDDYGYGEDSASMICSAVYPRGDYTAKKLDGDLDRIEAAGTICRFVCCDKPQLHSVKWTEWQTVAHPGKFRFCPCPVHAATAHEEHLRDSRDPREDFNPNVVEVNSDQRSSSGEPTVPTHPFAKCPDPRQHYKHRAVSA